MSQQNDLVDLDSDLETEFYERTLPDVTQMLKYAKIDKNNLTEITQAVYFPKVTSNDLENYMLLETNPTLVADIERGETLYLKGDSFISFHVKNQIVLFTKLNTEPRN